MKIALTIVRWLVGLLFIFSGLIKANDPLGLSYKMQEFFEAWHWIALYDYALYFSFTMNVFEVLAGVAIIVGWQKKLFSWLLLLLIIFFTFLTSYVLFSGKIKACGCFGDCIPLTPIQTFTKDVVLLLMILFLFFNTKKIKQIFSNRISIILILLTVVLTTALQLHVLKRLPLLDCLPYAKGKNIVEQMKVPADAVSDSFVVNYKYKKSDKIIEFDANHFPADFDSTYIYVDRYDKLIRQGNATPKIVDFNVKTLSGNDTTKEVLAQHGPYILLFAKVLPRGDYKVFDNEIFELIQAKKVPFYIITADVDADKLYSTWFTVLKCDATVIKTAARVNPTYFFMKEGDIIDKISYWDKKKIMDKLNSAP